VKNILQALNESPEPLSDREQHEAMRIQKQWLELPMVRKVIRSLGWDARIHLNSRLTYKDIRDTPRYNWHKWMLEQIRKERGVV
jgi:hypothetical protein